ncbi:hypothetical protein CYMTET_12016 [Cymbomonas tetramitiformis]|uniref:NACHT domain-containing protein n=1 Tax=Cymbomonas tetramitiformis TaxID=36881 RepID=A0AAE0GLI9_9CHLO|nr:hypothetical protein CYMTET_12016 [Cymbomonas tetramitiformis]
MGCGRLAKPEKPLHHDKDFAGDNFVSIKDAIASPATELDKTRDPDAALTWVVTQAADSVSETDVKGGSAAGSPDGELGGIKSGAVLRDLDARELDTAEQLQVVVDKRTKLLEVLCYASQANAARAQEELAKVHTAAVQVAWVALEPGSGAAEAPAVEDIIKLVDTLFQVLRQCALKPALVARVVGTLRCVQWLVLPAMRRVGVKQMDGEKWAREAREVRRICARMPRPRNITGSPALLELSLTRMEMTLSQLSGPGVAQTAGAVMKVAFGLGQLLLTGTGANTVVSGVKDGAKVLTSAARKALHKECFTELARMDVLAAAAAAARRRCPPGSPAEEVYGWVEDVQKLHFVRLPDGCWEPVPGRWEPKAAFAGLLGDLAMEGLKSGVCDTALLERLCLGEPSQVGLAQLLRLGLSDTLSVDGKRREAERLEEAERHAAWAHAQHRVRQSVEAQLRELEEAQRAAEREPDLLKKQLLLVQCRDMHAALAQSSRNVEDIGVALGVVVGFLTTVNAKLDAVNESLNELQSSVRELGADMRRMVGRPVLEELAEQRDKRLLQCQELRREVYIATDGVGPGDDGKFLVSESNKAEDLLEAVKTKLLKSEEVSLLLVSGPAGSGKSTFVSHLEMYLEMEYLEQTRGERGELVLVKVSLPTLKNPMADLFHEALARGYGLREAQIHELRNLARAGTVRLIFLLDAYDELPAQCLFKNLYMSNNLEQYRAQLDGDATPAYPKVIITTRTELLSRDPEYARAFVPMEMNYVSRASVEDARAAFLELRIAPFDSKLDRYIHAKVALEMRRELERHVGTLAALSKEAAGELQKKAESVLDSAQASSDTKMMLEAACAAVTAPRGDKEPLERVRRYTDQVPMRTTPTVFRVVWALAGALAEVPSGLQQALAEFCDRLARAETGKIWLHQDYREAFNAIPELTELTTTPFMVEIVTEILPKLQETRSTDASIKAKLLLLLSEDAAQMVWGCIGRWRGADDSILKQAQAGLEDKPSQAPAPGAGSGVTGLAEEVVRVLKGQGLLLKQDKLVKIGWEQLQAMGRVSAQGTTKGQAGGVDAGMADGPLTDLLTVLGGDAEVDELLREMVGELEEEESRLLEAISQTGIPYLLKSALQRPRVRRSQIYAMFVVMYVRREASKSLTRGTHEAGAVEQEGAQYAQRLALTMVAENMTKVPLGSGSKLFHEKSVWDPFLRDGGELRVAAQKAAPVRCDGGVLTFIHKTVQEYLCAASLRANLHHILRDLAAPLEELDEELQPEGKPEADTESARRQAGAGTGTERSKDGGAPELHGEGPPQAAVQQTEQVQRRRARAARALGRAEERLMQSEWAQVDLRDEDVVRDFLADLFLDDLEFREEVCFVVAWSERRCAGGCKAGGGGLACGLLLANVRALLGGALPKRSAGTLLHAAAADGSHFAVSKLLDMRRRGILDSVLIEGRDDEGRTPLFCAAQSGHAQVAAALLAAGARRDARSNLRPERFGLFGG